MESPTTENLGAILRGYTLSPDGLSGERLERFMSQFNQVKAYLQVLQEKTEAAVRADARGFNIFNLLGVARREEETHSAILADLLSPAGTHGQKCLFLTEFLQKCAQHGGPVPLGEDIATGAWVVEREKTIAGGKLDLVASSRPLRFLLVIENKIDASEQTEQLQRYADWMEGRRNLYPRQVLIYLTPRGGRPTTIEPSACLLFSYRQDIAAWLENALPHIAAPRLRETIVQYLEVVRAL